MDCELCKSKFDYSAHKPFYIIPCSHIYCYQCLTRLKTDTDSNCPKCDVLIENINPNWRLLFNIISKANDPIAYYNVANTLSQLGDYRGAIELHTKAIEIDPNYVNAYNNKGNCLVQLEEYSNAIKCYDKAIQINPNCVDAYYNKGNVFNNLKDYSEAIRYYNICIKLDPNYKMAYKFKANALQEQQDFTTAIKWYNKAIEMSPNDFDLFVSKGIYE